MNQLTITGRYRDSLSRERTIRSNAYNIDCFNATKIIIPKRDVTLVSVPGRSGDLILDNGRWENVDVTFSCVARQVAADETGLTKARQFLEDIHSMSGYLKLNTDFDPYNFWLGTLVNEVILNVTEGGEPGIVNREPFGKLCKFDLTFRCKPQRYLLEGDTPHEVSSGQQVVLNNPTEFTSAPLIRFNAPGTVKSGNYSVSFARSGSTPAYVIVDCDAMDAYNDSGENLNPYISATSSVNWLPLKPGDNTFINETSGTVIIYPRWWAL